jgi:uncharacterized SAM-binding protein YcdF (DUF218 family)
MNELLGLMGLTAWKPVMAAWVLPPVPFIVLMLVGARMLYWRRGLAWTVILLSCAGMWLSQCAAVGHWMQRQWLAPPPALEAEQQAELRRAAASGRKLAIVVLGGGREALAPEYGLSNLSPASLARLHYGLHLGRLTGVPVMFSGGVGWGASIGAAEAEAAARIAERDYGRPLKWQEAESRDTRENAARSLALLQPAGVTQVVLVTHGWHMPRALRAFQAEVQRHGYPMRVLAAPMGLASDVATSVDWLPSATGAALVRHVVHELLGLWSGA